MGVVEYWVENGLGNRLQIDCAEGAGRGASISFAVRGAAPAPKSLVRLFVGEADFNFVINESSIADTESRVNHGNFHSIWSAIRRSSSIRVLYQTGETISFSTKNASRILGKNPCKTGFSM
ncbi:MAG: hypothetical protein ACRCWF_01770 [Beijerinckiaceae bacterium]